LEGLIGDNMCGFVGFVDKYKKNKKQDIIKKMADIIVHRGPDSEGYYTNDDIALGHRRLSIIDLSSGKQPIFNEDKTKVIVFNGEIYNYEIIREDLIKKGHVFTTKTDTEVILHGYEEYGTDLFNKLRGMFAFLIYDIKTKELVGVRDHFGIKPFYYYLDDDEFMFASEIKAMLAHPKFKKEVNKKALKMYLIFQYSIFDETFFKNVYKLKPGHFFKYKDGKLEIEEYFHVEFEKTNKTYLEYKEELKQVLEESVKYHQMTSDVEVGSYLSGGVDSSYVASLAKPNKTFSVGFNVKNDGKFTFDETVYAKDLSKILKINNTSELISSDDFFEILPTVQYHTDEPHANLSTVPLYFLSRLASRDVKVVMSGEGSDEMFAGYNEYYEPNIVKLYLKLPLFLRKGFAKVVTPFPHFPTKNTIIKCSHPLDERYIGHAFVMNESEANEILCDDLKDDMKISDVLKPYYDKVKDKDDITKKMYIDYHFWLPQDILLKADKMTMANSVELRVPLLDKNLFASASKIPTKYLIRDKQTKYIFRDIAGEVIPNDWAKRRKLGFPVPFSKWLKEEKYYKMVKNMFEEEYVNEFFDQEKICTLLDEHYKDIKNNGRKIYNIYVFLIWYKKYFKEIG
jgi:asparagine synthase (glutamine-hydrolysing)